MKFRWLLSGLVGLFLLSATAVNAATLRLWQFDRNQNRLEFSTDTGVQPRAQLLANPTRLVIDLPGVVFGRPRQTEPLTGVYRNLRVAQFEQGITRIVVELAPGYTIDPKEVKFEGSYANQWTVQLPTPEPISPNASLDQTNDRIPATVLRVPPPQQTQLAPGTVAAQPISPKPERPLPRVPNGRSLVVIDPGHGGPDPGAIGIGGLREVDVIMPISLQVAELLRQQNIQVVLTRETDVDLGLEPRTQLANRLKATAFVSIHANAISMARPDVNGVETYYHSSGKALADSIHRNILAATEMRDRRVKRARFYVLRRTSMPSVLVEVGFVTGAEDAPRLADPEFRNKLAEAIARGILEYLQPGK